MLQQDRIILCFYFISITMCSLMYAVQIIQPSVLFWLGLTKATPWGIVTSIFMHLSLWHLANNMGALAIFSGIFILLLHFNDYANPKQVSLFFCWGPFLLAIVANMIYLTLSPEPRSAGASGVAYAIEGIVLTVSLSSITSRMSSDGIRTYLTSKKSLMHFVLNAGIFLYLFIFAMFYPYIYLGAEPGVNAAAHGFAFILGVLLIYFYEQFFLAKNPKER